MERIQFQKLARTGNAKPILIIQTLSGTKEV
jgi:hypothetical protein